MNDFILFKIVEITTCYKLISTYYNVHYKLRYFVQCHVVLGANNNCKLPLNELSGKRGHRHADMENADMENADTENADMENADKHIKILAW